MAKTPFKRTRKRMIKISTEIKRDFTDINLTQNTSYFTCLPIFKRFRKVGLGERKPSSPSKPMLPVLKSNQTSRNCFKL
jgi:hypothetical protein